MRKSHNVSPFVRHLALLAALLGFVLAPQVVAARSDAPGSDGVQRYIVELKDPPLARYDGRKLSVPLADGRAQLEALRSGRGISSRLNLQSSQARSYLGYLEDRHGEFGLEAAVLLGRQLRPVFRYRLATNGMAVDLTPAEAAILAEVPMIRSLRRDEKHFVETYAGPQWIGSTELWEGMAGYPEARGEGIVVGVIDTGINWESPSFADPSFDGYSFTNPRGQQYGFCDDPEVDCNNKLIGVYDYVEDDPSTDEVEENTKGRDIDGHGSHVASIAVGNPVNTTIESGLFADLSGVAPRANLITYRVCYTSACYSSAILQAIEQAIEDDVDIINYSIGSAPSDPWSDAVSRAFGAAREVDIIAVTSAGNDTNGPAPGTVGSPANAPWILAVGYSTHDQVLGNRLQNMTGGDTPPPEDMAGASQTGGTGQLNIVHARDYGFPLCGVGEPEFGPECDDNLGQSNPWAGETPFNGEIVVCDRGTYGRVEKGKNVLLAGAGGYILANTSDFAESVDSEEHCLPTSHIGVEDGDRLRAWLAGGSGHGGQISAIGLESKPSSADVVAFDSARGPLNLPGEDWVEDTLKPNLIAPGKSIWAASEHGQAYQPLSGTSMSSPHVAGAAALLKSVHRGWGPSQLASAIETTSTPELARNRDGNPAEPHDRGSGRPQLGEAANAGLSLEVTSQEFFSADPQLGGDPKDLNLAGLVDSSCSDVCTFTRTVTDQMGGGSWTATAEDFPDGAIVSVNPQNFTLTNGSSRSLQIDVDVADIVVVGQWISGRVRLSAAGSPDQYLTVSVSTSDLSIEDDRNGGWQAFTLVAPVELPDATFQSGGLTKPDRTSEVLPQDPTNDDPYDGGEGVLTKWHALPQGGLWLHAETLASTAEDLDLYVGRDENGNGVAEAFEELCASISPGDVENCELLDPPPGDYWIIVQNWTAGPTGEDEATLVSAAIAPGPGNNLAASGPGIVGAGDEFGLRLSWDNLSALPGEEWLGAIGIGSSRESPNDTGVFPVRFLRTGIAEPSTFPLQESGSHQLALAAGGTHDRMFIDVPPGAGRLTVAASAVDSAQNNSLTLELRRLDFADALAPPPFAAPPDSAPVAASATGSGGIGPTVAVGGPALQPGRWYAVLISSDDAEAAIEIIADLDFTGDPLPVHRGLWEPSSRPGLGQGYDYNWGGTDRALIWYTYDEDGQPAWYIAGAPEPPHNIWTSLLYRVTNDGERQQLAPVGYVSVTTLAEDDSLFTYTLFGQSGTERMQPLSPQTCPIIGDVEQSYTGIWYRGIDGIGGASVLVSALTQAQIHYLFDGFGVPRWLFAQDLENPEPTNEELPMLQFSGYCAVCAEASVSFRTVGLLERTFADEETGSWTLDYVLQPPLSGSVQRTEQIIKLTDTLECR
jgi:subtilisin family serine protease